MLYSFTRHRAADPSSKETLEIKKGSRKRREEVESNSSRMPSVSFYSRKKKELATIAAKRKEEKKRRSSITNPYDKTFPLTDDLIDDAIAFLTLS